MSVLEENKITKEEFLKINEDDVMFITNPGRMGDEDGSTFIVRQDGGFKVYRISGWMYPSEDIDEKERISLQDAYNQFPRWRETLNHFNDENYKGKYKHIYRGFGNGLSIDNSIYDEFKPYLDQLVEEYIKDSEDKESLKPAATFNTWKIAFNSMTNNKSNIRQ